MLPMRVMALRRLPGLVVRVLMAAAGCDIVTADFRSEETAEWRKTYQLAPGGKVEIINVNGKMDVQPGTGNVVEVVALKKAKGPSSEAAKAALDRITFEEDATPAHIRIETKVAKNAGGGLFHGHSPQVEYHVKVPAGAEVRFTTVN